jgi:hypothetical protein
MPDNSARNAYQRGLRGGRKPSGLANVPYRIEEWGKSRSYFLAAGSAERLKSITYPVSVEEYDRATGPRTPKRGPPSTGTLVIYIGEETKLPPRDSKEAGFAVRVVEEGFAYTKRDARDRLDAYIRRRQWAQTSKARRRAAQRS